MNEKNQRYYQGHKPPMEPPNGPSNGPPHGPPNGPPNGPPTGPPPNFYQNYQYGGNQGHGYQPYPNNQYPYANNHINIERGTPYHPYGPPNGQGMYYAQQPMQQKKSNKKENCILGCLGTLCLCYTLDMLR